MIVGVGNQRAQCTGLDFGVRVQQEHVSATGRLDGLVVRGGITAVAGVGDQLDGGVPLSDEIHAAVARAVVDDVHVDRQVLPGCLDRLEARVEQTAGVPV